MTLEQLWRIALEHFPACHVTEDIDGEIVIATGLMMEGPPLGMQGLTAANIPVTHQQHVQLREMTGEDIT